MKRPVKVPAVAAVILTLAMAGVSSARAGGWPVAAGVVGGFAAETIVRRAVANYTPRRTLSPGLLPVMTATASPA